MSYNHCHRAFLQAIMQRGAVTDADARELAVKIFNRNDSIQAFVHQVNQKLKPLNMMIKDASCELTGQKYWVFISTVLDEAARFQFEFSPGQLEFLRKVFSEIITSENGSAQSTMCLNLSSTQEHRFSKADASDFLKDMTKKGWFHCKDGNIYIGVRSVAELIPYFRTTYTLNTCSLCRQVVFHGETCVHCQEVLHLYCLANYAAVQKPPKCPSCNNMMPVDHIQGIDAYLADPQVNAAKEEEMDVTVTGSSGRNARVRSKRISNGRLH